MTIEEAQEKAIQLRRAIARLVNEFESETGCLVESIDLHRGGTMQNPRGRGQAMVRVDVELPS